MWAIQCGCWTPTQVLCKSSVCSKLLAHLSSFSLCSWHCFAAVHSVRLLSRVTLPSACLFLWSNFPSWLSLLCLPRSSHVTFLLSPPLGQLCPLLQRAWEHRLVSSSLDFANSTRSLSCFPVRYCGKIYWQKQRQGERVCPGSQFQATDHPSRQSGMWRRSQGNGIWEWLVTWHPQLEESNELARICSDSICPLHFVQARMMVPPTVNGSFYISQPNKTTLHSYSQRLTLI